MNNVRMILPMSVALAIIGFPTVCCRANLIVNGSFETGNLSGWTTSNPNGMGDFVQDGSAQFSGGKSDGAFGLQMNAGNTTPDFVFQQTVTTVAGVEYILSFDYARYDPDPNPNVWTARIQVEVIGTSPLLTDVASDARQNLGGSFDPLEPGEFLTFTRSFIADGPSTTLRFSDISDDTFNADTMADNFRLLAVPEPASLTLCAIGIVCLMGAWRRRKTA